LIAAGGFAQRIFQLGFKFQCRIASLIGSVVSGVRGRASSGAIAGSAAPELFVSWVERRQWNLQSRFA